MIYQVGDTIGRYTITGELGSGTFGIVYLVEWLDRKGTRQGALKILKDPKFKEILEEVSTWARVSHHPNILTFIGATEHDKEILLISEYASDGNLEDWIKTHAGKKESLENAVRLMLGVLRGLEHLHDNDIVHRDIKPANILLKGDTPLLADFGLARGLDLVQTYTVTGTLLYMSPELINALFNQELGTPRYERTEADDLWAAAATFYEMFAGDLPFKSINQIRDSSPNPLPSHVPKELRDVVEKALQKDITRRFQTATGMCETLEKAWDDFRQREERQTIEDIAWQAREKQRRKAEEERQRQQAIQDEDKRRKEVERQREAEDILGLQELKQQEEARIKKENEERLARLQIDEAKQKEETKKKPTWIVNFIVYFVALPLMVSWEVIKKLTWTRIGALAMLGTFLVIISYLLPSLTNSPNSETYFNRGYECSKKKDYDCAVDNYTKAIELNPQYADAYYNRGVTYDDKGNYDQAIRDYNKTIGVNSQYANAYYNRGNAYNDKGSHDRAIKDYDKAIELNPQYADAYNNRGLAYYNNRNYEQAIKEYDKVVELNPQFAGAYSNRGLAYYKKRNYEQAIRDYDKAIELNPQYASAYNNRGNVYNDRGNYDRASKDYSKAIELNPQYANYNYNNRGVTYEKLGQTAKAKADYQKYKELSEKK